MTNLGDNVKRLREHSKMTMKELSLKSGVGKSTISEIETGKATNPKSDTLAKISSALGVTINDLLSTEEKLGMAVDSIYKISEMAFKGLDFSVNEDSANYKVDNLTKENKLHTLAAHFEGEEFTNEDVEDIENFIKFVLSKKKK